MVEFNDGIFIWVLYSKENGAILKTSTIDPFKSKKIQVPQGYVWGTFITSKVVLNKIHKYSVTKSGLEKTINRYFVVR